VISTTFLLTTLCTLVQNFGDKRVRTRALRIGLAAQRRAAPRRGTTSCATPVPRAPRLPSRAPSEGRPFPETPRALRPLEFLPSSRSAPAGRTASIGPLVASVPHDHASYRGRRPPLGTSPSTLRSQACARVALKQGRCYPSTHRPPPPTAPCPPPAAKGAVQ
jgi:hypothetical protein